jgi:hypothetical protein
LPFGAEHAPSVAVEQRPSVSAAPSKSEFAGGQSAALSGLGRDTLADEITEELPWPAEIDAAFGPAEPSGYVPSPAEIDAAFASLD